MPWLAASARQLQVGGDRNLAWQKDSMSELALIYLIVALNIVVQLMLIGRLRFPSGGKRKYYAFAVAIPVLVLLSMRLLTASGLMQSRVAEQPPAEQFVTAAASILLMAGPWLATLAAILDKKRSGWAIKPRDGS
jgi:hypothetical protein